MADQFGTSVTVTPQQEVTVTVTMNTIPEHVGQIAALLLVIAKELPPEP